MVDAPKVQESVRKQLRRAETRENGLPMRMDPSRFPRGHPKREQWLAISSSFLPPRVLPPRPISSRSEQLVPLSARHHLQRLPRVSASEVAMTRKPPPQPPRQLKGGRQAVLLPLLIFSRQRGKLAALLLPHPPSLFLNQRQKAAHRVSPFPQLLHHQPLKQAPRTTPIPWLLALRLRRNRLLL